MINTLRSRVLVIAALGVMALLAMVASVHAQQAVSHQTLSVFNGTASGLAAATTDVPNVGKITFCVGSVEGSSARYWLDGSAPTTTSGHLSSPGGQFVLPSYQTAAGFQVTTTGGVTTLQVSCFRGGTPAVFASTFDPSLATVPIVNTVSPATALPLPPCNALVRTSCK